MRRVVLSVLAYILLQSCGYKYPMPPEPEEGIPPESSYVLVGDFWEVSGALDLLRASDGRIYILFSDRVEKWYSSGIFKESFGEGVLTDPRAICEGSGRRIFVLEKDGVDVFSFRGEYEGKISLPGLTNHRGVASGPNRIYISEPDENLILYFDTLGNFIDTLVREGNGILNVENPMGIFYDPLDRLLVASSGHNWVEAFSPDTPTTNLLHLGGSSPEGGSEEGEFISPLDVAADDYGSIFVADSGNARVQKFNRDGEFIVTVDTKEGEPLRIDVEPDGNAFYVLLHTKDGERIAKYKKTPKPGGGS
jgi:hypothetical protein